ncbi:Lipase, class 3, partial [Nannochloropsis gaditana]
MRYVHDRDIKSYWCRVKGFQTGKTSQRADHPTSGVIAVGDTLLTASAAQPFTTSSILILSLSPFPPIPFSGTALHAARWGHTANRGVASVSRYLSRTLIARAAAATVTEMSRFTADRTREVLDYATLQLVQSGHKPLPPENGWGDVGRRLGSISAYDLQLIDEKVRDVGLSEFADMLGVADPGELLRVAELRLQAAQGDEDAQYALAARFCPPPFRKRDRCKKCHKAFGVTRYRHHCRHCGESFCQEHSAFRHAIPKVGYMVPARVCGACKGQLEDEDLKDRVVWRMVRVEAFLKDRLIPYFAPGDHTHLDRALRTVGGWVSRAARRAPPLRSTTALAGEALELFSRYGYAGVAGVLLRHEHVEAVELLKAVSGVDAAWPVTGSQLSAAMYYLLARGRGERGAAPDAEQEAHRGCPPASDSLMQDLLDVAPLALHFAYCDNLVEMQLKAQQQGWRLVFAYAPPAAQAGQPAFVLLCHLTEKEACLVVRGPDRAQDVLVDIRGLPMPFPLAGEGAGSGEKGSQDKESGWANVSTEWMASCGAAEAGHWLFSEVYPHLHRLAKEGYSLTLAGHSAGGAVAALLGVLMREEGMTEGLRCYTFGSPACVNQKLAQVCEAFVTTVVLHDDVIPRVTPTGVRGLLKDLLSERERAEQHWQDDVEAIIVRSKGHWAPRWRRVLSRGGREKGAAPGSRSLSFIRSEDEGERGEGEGEGWTGRTREGEGKEGGVGEGAGEGWDSCDDDLGNYWGVGCTRDVVSVGSGAASNRYSIRHEDGTTTTVNLALARRRLLDSGGDAAADRGSSVSKNVTGACPAPCGLGEAGVNSALTSLGTSVPGLGAASSPGAESGEAGRREG